MQVIKDAIHTYREVRCNMNLRIFEDDLFWILSAQKRKKHISESKILNKQRKIFKKENILTLRICDENIIKQTDKKHWMKAEAFSAVIEGWEYKNQLFFHKEIQNWNFTDFKILVTTQVSITSNYPKKSR